MGRFGVKLQKDLNLENFSVHPHFWGGRTYFGGDFMSQSFKRWWPVLLIEINSWGKYSFTVCRRNSELQRAVLNLVPNIKTIP